MLNQQCQDTEGSKFKIHYYYYYYYYYRVSQFQKGKNQSAFTGARDSERQWHQLGHMQICTFPQVPLPQYSVFYRLDTLPAAQPTASKHSRQKF